MDFKEQFIEAYRATRRAAKANDQEGTIAGLRNLYELFLAQFKKDNGDPIRMKATLRRWQNIFGGYIQIIRSNGLSDRRVQKFFGLIKADDIPSLGDLLGGQHARSGNTPPQGGDRLGGVDISGIVPPSDEAAHPVSADPIETPVQIPEPIQPEAEAPAGSSAEAPAPIGLPEEPAGSTSEEPMPSENEPKGENEPKEEDGNAPSGETTAAPSYNPDTLEGFIGQQHIVKVLLKEIAIAKAEGKHHLDNILLFGNPGLGKSTLMRLIAKALGVRYELIDCSRYRNGSQSSKALQNFLMEMARKNEPVVIAFDEVHLLTDEMQSSLLTLLESREYVSSADDNKRVPVEFTFIAATTDDNKVLNTIKDRCLRLKFQMVDYTLDELNRIYRTKVAAKGLTITEEAIEACIPRSRGSIRYVNSFVEGLDRELYTEDGKRISTHIDLATALRFFDERGIDEIGLEKKDLEILRTIESEVGGIIGLETLAARVGLDSKKYVSEFEPYLIKIGFVSVTKKGRCLTDKAKEYLNTKKSEN